jgi:hypothetical protein
LLRDVFHGLDLKPGASIMTRPAPQPDMQSLLIGLHLSHLLRELGREHRGCRRASQPPLPRPSADPCWTFTERVRGTLQRRAANQNAEIGLDDTHSVDVPVSRIPRDAVSRFGVRLLSTDVGRGAVLEL